MSNTTGEQLEDLVTPERLAKGDLATFSVKTGGGRSRIAAAEVEDATILAHLVRIGILEDHHLTYGLGFLELQHAFLSRLRHKGTSIFFVAGGGGLTREEAADMYVRICKAISNKRVDAIKYVCESYWSLSSVVKYHNSDYVEFFEKLVSEMDIARDELKAEKERLAN